MISPSSPIHGLVWKETRQIVPLAISLLITAALLVSAWSMFATSYATMANAGKYLPLVLPTLFAAGAAAVLIGQEKDQKTLWWLVSLPAPASKVIRTKMFVAITGLLVMWIACFLMASLTLAARPGLLFESIRFSGRELLRDYGVFIAHSLFVLLCGFYTAWRFQNTFHSLLAIIPLAVFPFAVIRAGRFLQQLFGENRYADLHTPDVLAFSVQCVSILVVGTLGYRAGTRALYPTAPPDTDTATRTLRPLFRLPWIGRHPSRFAPEQPYESPTASLVWQMVRSQRGTLACTAAMLMTSLMALAIAYPFELEGLIHDVPLLGIATALIGVCSLGVSVFSGDGDSHRIRFLAERGVRPTKIWMARHAVGLCLVSCVLLLYFAVTNIRMNVAAHLETPMISLSLIGVICLASYSISQWVSQLFRTLVASALIAPLLSVSFVWWLVFATAELHAPRWLLLLLCVIPLLATWLWMPRYIDGRSGAATWVFASLVAASLILLPVMPLAVRVAKSPGISQTTRAALMPQAELAWKQSDRPTVITSFRFGISDDQDEAEESGSELLNRLENEIQDYHLAVARLAEPGESGTAVSIDRWQLQTLLASASYAKLAFDHSPTNEIKISELDRWIESLTGIAGRLRKSRNWIDQHHADFLEIWLTQTLSSDSFEPMLQTKSAAEAIKRVADQTGRNRSRKRAVLATWHETSLSTDNTRLRNRFVDAIPENDSLSPIEQWLTSSSRLDAFFVAALELIENGSRGQSTEMARRNMHNYFFGSQVQFRDGPYGDRLRVGGISGSRPVGLPRYIAGAYVACQWYAPWETDASNLADRYLTDSQTSK